MYQLEIDQSTSTAILFLSGSMTVNIINEIKEAFQNALSVTNNLCIDQTAVSEFDLSYMQILISLHLSANTVGKKISLIGSGSESFKSMLNMCGCPHYAWLATENLNDIPEGK